MKILRISVCAALVAALAAPLFAAVPRGGTIGLRQVAAGLTSPVALVDAPDGSDRLFIVDQIGLIRVLSAGALLPTPFLDLRARIVPLRPSYDERGLLGLAFHPDYEENGRFFVFYNAPLRAGGPAGWDDTVTISEFSVSDDPNVADATSERIVLEIDKPQFNHNGGTLLFGPDGNLYISVGDGGGANDVDEGHVEDWYAANAGGNGQDIEANLLGSILRLDVDGVEPYAVPADNPFVGRDGMDEIWAYGFRNPYRMAFDGATLLVGDAGQGRWEEVSLAVKGGNYGWNVKEGTHCFNAADSTDEPADCPDQDPDGVPLRDPVIEYPNANNSDTDGVGVVVVGGDVYRGSALPQLRGRYIFGDFSRTPAAPDGTILLAKPRKKGLWKVQELKVQGRSARRLGHYLLAFGQDASGEMYVLATSNLGPTGSTGKVFKIVPTGKRK